MYHHDSRPYAEAVSEAAAKGRVKLEEIIHNGMKSAEQVVEQIQSRQVQDRIVRTTAIRIQSEDGQRWDMAAGEFAAPLHDHAFGQVVADAGIGMKFIDHVRDEAQGCPWGKELVAHTLNTVLANRTKQRNLVRQEGTHVKGFLSDKYRRLDSRPLLDSFIAAAHKGGLVPVDGKATETKSRVRALLPKVFEPAPGEVVAFGLEWGNSDYGDGGHVVNLFMLRVWCTNLAVAESCLRHIHLGRRLDDNIEYSARTLELDTKANAAALADTVRHAIGPARVAAMLDTIRAAKDDSVGGMDVESRLKKLLNKGDVEKVEAIFNGPDVVNVPAGQNAWRLSNAVSWFAQTKGFSVTKQLELQDVAGKLLPVKAAKPREV